MERQPEKAFPLIGQMTAEETLNAMQKDAVPFISEQDFFNMWLGLLSGKQGKPGDIFEWTRVSGSVYQRVKVLDDQGNELFEVPPLAAHTAPEMSDKSGRPPKIPLLSLVRHASQLQAAGRVGEARRVFNAYIDKFLRMDEPDRALMEEWNAIFARYPATQDLVVDFKNPVPPQILESKENPEDPDEENLPPMEF